MSKRDSTWEPKDRRDLVERELDLIYREIVCDCPSMEEEEAREREREELRKKGVEVPRYRLL